MAASLSRLHSTATFQYYTRDNYYTKEDGIEHSSWFGLGAKMLGLFGKIDKEKFANLMEGKTPDGKKSLGTEPRNRKNKKTGKIEKHRSGVDITFSPPKSVSIEALLNGNKNAQEAHEIAVKKTLSEIEEKYSMCRVGSRGNQTNELCGNLIVARFEHDSSRSNDPQIHTHCVILSSVRRKNGDWRRLNNDPFWKNSKNINDIYIKNLKEEIKNKNIEIIDRDNFFEIKGYEKDLLDNFSKQTKKINKMKESDLFKEFLEDEIKNGRDINKSLKYVERREKIKERENKKKEIHIEDKIKKWKKEYYDYTIKKQYNYQNTNKQKLEHLFLEKNEKTSDFIKQKNLTDINYLGLLKKCFINETRLLIQDAFSCTGNLIIGSVSNHFFTGGEKIGEKIGIHIANKILDSLERKTNIMKISLEKYLKDREDDFRSYSNDDKKSVDIMKSKDKDRTNKINGIEKSDEKNEQSKGDWKNFFSDCISEIKENISEHIMPEAKNQEKDKNNTQDRFSEWER